jgi:hypothetical protein
MKLSLLATDLEKEQSGVWVKYRNTEVQFKIARAGSEEFQAACRKARLAHKIQAEDAEISEDENRAIIAPVLAKHILKDWKNIEDDDGTPIPFTEQRAAEMLAQPEFKDVVAAIMLESASADNFRKKAEKKTQGN